MGTTVKAVAASAIGVVALVVVCSGGGAGPRGSRFEWRGREHLR